MVKPACVNSFLGGLGPGPSAGVDAPGRSLGPALAAGELGALWIYLLAPLIGAALGALAYQLVRGEPAGMARAAGDI